MEIWITRSDFINLFWLKNVKLQSNEFLALNASLFPLVTRNSMDKLSEAHATMYRVARENLDGNLKLNKRKVFHRFYCNFSVLKAREWNCILNNQHVRDRLWIETLMRRFPSSLGISIKLLVSLLCEGFNEMRHLWVVHSASWTLCIVNGRLIRWPFVSRWVASFGRHCVIVNSFWRSLTRCTWRHSQIMSNNLIMYWKRKSRRSS